MFKMRSYTDAIALVGGSWLAAKSLLAVLLGSHEAQVWMVMLRLTSLTGLCMAFLWVCYSLLGYPALPVRFRRYSQLYMVCAVTIATFASMAATTGVFLTLAIVCMVVLARAIHLGRHVADYGRWQELALVPSVLSVAIATWVFAHVSREQFQFPTVLAVSIVFVGLFIARSVVHRYAPGNATWIRTVEDYLARTEPQVESEPPRGGTTTQGDHLTRAMAHGALATDGMDMPLRAWSQPLHPPGTTYGPDGRLILPMNPANPPLGRF